MQHALFGLSLYCHNFLQLEEEERQRLKEQKESQHIQTSKDIQNWKEDVCVTQNNTAVSMAVNDSQPTVSDKVNKKKNYSKKGLIFIFALDVYITYS